MNNISKESVQLTDADLAVVSGGRKTVHMPPTTIIIFTEGSTITVKRK
jgi:hypothetical protein